MTTLALIGQGLVQAAISDDPRSRRTFLSPASENETLPDGLPTQVTASESRFYMYGGGLLRQTYETYLRNKFGASRLNHRYIRNLNGMTFTLKRPRCDPLSAAWATISAVIGERFIDRAEKLR